jgi:hypothetical protein
VIYLVLAAHWIADFICQTDKMAINKSTSWKWLSSHVGTYTLLMLPFGPVFAIANGLTHLFVDAVTSRATSYLWKKGDRHNFFVVIGLDQLIHTAILISTMPLIGWHLP